MTCPRSRPIPRARLQILLAGIFALGWLILRTGTKPSRVAYPCQQAAMGTASLVFGAPLVAALLLGRRRAQQWARSPRAMAALVLGVVAFIGVHAILTRAEPYTGPVLDPPREYRAAVYHVTDCPENPATDRLVGLDNLLTTMGRGGLKFYQSPVPATLSGPDGLLGRDDVILIKINYQWSQRGGTNTDLLRGLLRRIVDHPDGFTGEIVICENAQFASTSGFDRAENNAQDQSLSPRDVALGFQSLGYDVSLFDWTPIRYNQVGEYDTGDSADGYVVGDYDAEVQGRASYPKFQTDSGTHISLKHGIWDPWTSTYSREKLRFINLPVLKSHHAVYGATVSVKHYMGVVSRELGTNSHNAIRYGILGEVLAQIQLADLNILDAIWINANPYTGPSTSYSGATRRDELVASVDPVALDIWAVKNILIPGFIANGYTSPWPTPSADPDDPSSAFRTYLDNSMSQLLDAGYTVTNDLGQIDEVPGRGDAGDFDRDGDVDGTDYGQLAGCFTGPDVPFGAGCDPADFDLDGDVDCDDVTLFRTVWTEGGTPPVLPACLASDAPVDQEAAASLAMGLPYPNPMKDGTTIEYTLTSTRPVNLTVHDVTGRRVRRLVDSTQPAGTYEVSWDGRGELGDRVPAGLYSIRLVSGHVQVSQKLLVR